VHGVRVRAGVERVMGFCSKKDVECFFDTVNDFEALLVRSGTHVRKYYLDISHAEQKKRLKERESDPLQTWKNSPIWRRRSRRLSESDILRPAERRLLMKRVTRLSRGIALLVLAAPLCAAPPEKRPSREYTIEQFMATTRGMYVHPLA
jgi:hypothetical protein